AIGPRRGISVERSRRGGGGGGGAGKGCGTACSRRRIPTRLRAASGSEARGEGGGERPRGRQPAGGAGVGGPGPSDWSTARETLPHAAGSDWPSASARQMELSSMKICAAIPTSRALPEVVRRMPRKRISGLEALLQQDPTIGPWEMEKELIFSPWRVFLKLLILSVSAVKRWSRSVPRVAADRSP
uniref:Uncharacterized protein n=1 Tax=Pongo abelii TaxID=9601 RepID=A0A8I5U6K8_PONAB